MNVFLVGLALLVYASPSSATVAAVKDTTFTAWPNTIYYVARITGPSAPYKDPVINITGVDKYTLYVNGQLIGSDDNWSTVDQYPLKGTFSDFFIGVKVENTGKGNGNGIMVDIKTGTNDWLGTSIQKRRSTYVNNIVTIYPVQWYAFVGDIQTTLGKADWYNLNADFFDVTSQPPKAKNISTFLDSNNRPLFKWVIYGNMGNLNYTPTKRVEIVSGYDGNMDIGSTKGGGISIRRYDGEDIALYKPSVDYKLVDGDLQVGYPYTGDPTGATRYIDLLDIYKLNKMVVYTGGANPQDWPSTSVRGFEAQADLSSGATRLSLIHEVGISNADNGGYDYAEVPFQDTWARYSQIYIFEARIKPPNLGEIMLYGTGYLYNATYESPWINLGSATTLKNFGKVTWVGDIPAESGPNAQIVVQTQTRFLQSDGKPSTPSAWSAEHIEKSFDFDSPEPATEFKYKVTLVTDHVSRTPVFRALSVSYSTIQPLVDGTASVVPTNVKMGEPTDFTYTLKYSLAAGQDLKTMDIMVPNYAKVTRVFSSDANKDVPFTFSSTSDKLTVTFTSPIKNTDGQSPDSLKIYFSAALLKNTHKFESLVYNSTLNDSLNGVKIREDYNKSPLRTWLVTTSTIVSDIISKAQARPKVFTPNGDRKNDYTVFEFRLAKAETKIKIKIFDTAGNLVKKLYDGKLTPRDYIGDNDPGRWDGKNDDNSLVPPGIYIYQIQADTDDGLKVESGTVVVAY